MINSVVDCHKSPSVVLGLRSSENMALALGLHDVENLVGGLGEGGIIRLSKQHREYSACGGIDQGDGLASNSTVSKTERKNFEDDTHKPSHSSVGNPTVCLQ